MCLIKHIWSNVYYLQIPSMFLLFYMATARANPAASWFVAITKKAPRGRKSGTPLWEELHETLCFFTFRSATQYYALKQYKETKHSAGGDTLPPGIVKTAGYHNLLDGGKGEGTK